MEKEKSFKSATIPPSEDSELKNNKSNNFEEEYIPEFPKNKFKKYYMILKTKIKNYPDLSLLIGNIFGMLLYGISLKGCYGGAENYCATVFVKIFKILAVLVLIDSLLIAITLVTIQKRITHYFHLIYIFIVYLLFYLYDHGTTLVRHGFHNMTIFILFSLIFYGLINLVLYLLKLYRMKKYIKMIIIIIAPPIIIFSIITYVNIKSSCKDFSLGYNNTRIINLPNEACKFDLPTNCRMNFFDGKLNASKIFSPINYDSRKTFLTYLNKEKYDKSYYFGYPNSAHFICDNYFDNVQLFELNENEMIDMEKFDYSNKSLEIPEITVKFNKKGKGTISMNVYKNETLVKERKKLENNNSLFDNFLIIYTDTVSRNHFKSAFPKLGKFLERFMKYPKEKTSKGDFEAYEFLKYQALGYFTQINAQPMFFGESMKSNTGKSIINYYTQNGFITGHSWNHCLKDFFLDEKIQGTKNVIPPNWDHENILMFCDNNYYDKNNYASLKKGIHAVTPRIIYGRNSFEYVIDYGIKFWETYKDSKKLFRMAFMDGHEDTGEVIKFMDDYLTKSIEMMYDKGYLKNTLIMVMSDHGLHISRIFPVLAMNHYFYDRLVPYLFIMYDYNPKINNTHILINQQKLITAYDIYETMYHNVLGNTYKPNHPLRNSLFLNINHQNRTCANYQEITKINCRCH